MDTLEERAREAVASSKQKGTSSRVPDNVREVVLEYARERRAQGISWRSIARSIGLGESSLCRWATGKTRASGKGRMIPVEVVREPVVAATGTGLVLISGNYRVEGLDVAMAAELLGRLA